MALGACREDAIAAPESVTERPIGGLRLLEVTCAMWAYQASFEVWRLDGDVLAPLTVRGAPLRSAGLPEFDEATRRISWLSKARGPGDCGEFTIIEIRDAAAFLVEKRARDCDAPPPEHDDLWSAPHWPLVEPTPGLVGTLVSVQDGDTAGHVVLRDADGREHHWLASYDATTGPVGQEVRLRMDHQRVRSDACQGEPDCTLTQDADLVVEITPVR
jgi:hypothetical protein